MICLQVRKFGSRRHYSFSSEVFWDYSQEIVRAVAKRYGEHPAVVGWQLDNEFGCHGTVRSYDNASLEGMGRCKGRGARQDAASPCPRPLRGGGGLSQNFGERRLGPHIPVRDKP